MDWLNEITDSRFRFFGLEVELWRIKDSPAAPRFNVISKPNNWTRSVGSAARQIDNEAVTETKAQQLRYWQALNEYIDSHELDIRTRSPRPQHWTTYSVGRSKFNFAATINRVDARIGFELFIRGEHAKAFFALLLAQKEQIEEAIGEALSWEELPDRIGSRIAIHKEDTDPTDESGWDQQHAWLADMLTRFNSVFRQRVRNLDLSDLRQEDLED